MNSLPTRDQIDNKYKWRLEDIYENDILWENDIIKVKALLKSIENFKGKIDNPKNLLDILTLQDEINLIAEKVFTYARMRRDEDNSNSYYQSLCDKAMILLSEVKQSLSFIVPEILSISTDKLLSFFEIEKKLEFYRIYIEDLLRRKKHTLSQEEEYILALSSELSNSPNQIFSMFNDADIKFPNIIDENGNEIELTKGRYVQFLKNKDRRVRKDAFYKLYETYAAYKNTISATYSASVKRDIFYAKARKYNSSLEASLDNDNIPISVYDNLIAVVNNHLDLHKRYLNLRREILNLDQLNMYDVYVPLVDDVNVKIKYEDASNIVIESIKPFGTEYMEVVKQAFNSSWIDVYENRGKTSGAYSWGCYGVHPYILLNYQDSLDDVFTLAHEMGHSMHTYYSYKNQPYIYSDYSIFVAEVASTLNEILLTNYLLNNFDDEKQKLYIINHYLDEFRATVFRQTMFAEFEKITHESLEQGIPLTTETLCNIYFDLVKKYFGDVTNVNEQIAFEWMRIPHFYRAFYVFKYATSFSAATSLSVEILNGNSDAIKKYLNFLSSGSLKYPIELLKDAGVDMNTPKPIESAMKVFEEMLNKFEKLLKFR
ncbi:oligoendopeptidase F [Caldicellulosiruptoraceae bacterium PP1]